MAYHRGWWRVLCLDLRRQMGELVQGMGPLPCLVADLLCDPGKVTAPAWASVSSVIRGGQFLPCCEQGHWEEGVRLKSQTPTACRRQEFTECTCN